MLVFLNNIYPSSATGIVSKYPIVIRYFQDKSYPFNIFPGYEFDIKALKSETKYTVENSRGHKFDLNVCSPVKGSPCVGDSGDFFKLKHLEYTSSWGIFANL